MNQNTTLQNIGGTLCSSRFPISLQLLFPQGQLNEDKLRCKLRVLENQLQACTQVMSDSLTNTGEERQEDKTQTL